MKYLNEIRQYLKESVETHVSLLPKKMKKRINLKNKREIKKYLEPNIENYERQNNFNLFITSQTVAANAIKNLEKFKDYVTIDSRWSDCALIQLNLKPNQTNVVFELLENDTLLKDTLYDLENMEMATPKDATEFVDVREENLLYANPLKVYMKTLMGVCYVILIVKKKDSSQNSSVVFDISNAKIKNAEELTVRDDGIMNVMIDITRKAILYGALVKTKNGKDLNDIEQKAFDVFEKYKTNEGEEDEKIEYLKKELEGKIKDKKLKKQFSYTDQ